MEEKLKEIKAYSLSNEDIQSVLGPETRILSYPDFAEFNHIDEAFDSEGRCVFLFLTQSATSGHWMCMFKRDGDIEYFDSYGERPEAQRDWLSEQQLDELGQGEPYLWNLLKRSRKRVFYNKHQYQTDKMNVNNCGRWVIARLLNKDRNNIAFYNLVTKSRMSPDNWVCVYTYEMLGK
jgi:hypothetical protein